VYRSNVADLDCVPAEADEAVDGCRQLRRIILARPVTDDNPGVTTDLLISQQLDPATTEIATRMGDANPSNDVQVILVSVGGNDVSRPVLGACLGGLNDPCLAVIHERISHVDVNLDVIFGELRQAAGPETPIVTLTYDNTIANCDLGQIRGAKELGDLVLEGNPALGITGLNDVIRLNAANHGLAVADTFGQLGADQWVGGQDCLHPNDAGHAEIAAIAVAALPG
jgi:lysophospholipase L1-like esterase